jgi:hypothetical protein
LPPDVGSLGTLVTAAQDHHNNRSTLDVIDPISRAIVNLHLVDPGANGLGIAGVTE